MVAFRYLYNKLTIFQLYFVLKLFKTLKNIIRMFGRRDVIESVKIACDTI